MTGTTAKERIATRKNTVVNLRMSNNTRSLIDDAAGLLGKTRTDFIIESSQRHATEVLLERRLIALDRAQFDAFQKALDAPPAPNKALKRLMVENAPWEK
ncbi:MAG: DUF1778 domain-containing protein [Alphaproteobacteria bacterium]|jgi:uncharacterized protein (DUF1778 family)|nr:DUF1778 domain-containing protein [Alphaproteobacteria bacterium]MBN9568844.1 DUF1778 domain-containing protein [Alphaproteobacteria bacterium]MBN9570325.1 DUF1778 domain-containing protein [Alphaproteobacteria bacterium]MBN9579485.1 DUF1778 domain-containing protein [Alphaproteobacteria bacterium]OJU56598.1 MAG: hypothetical protein BGO00_13930 [Alphaproteobacteria bacterium 62-8]